MEPEGPSTGGGALPPPTAMSAVAVDADRTDAGVVHPTSVLPQFAPAPTSSHPGHSPVSPSPVNTRGMAIWRLVASGSVLAVFALSGTQVQRVVDGQERAAGLLAGTVAAWVLGMVAVLVWTYVVTDNARRLVSPATTTEPPNPWKAVSTWWLPMTFLTVAAVVIMMLSRAMDTSGEDPSSIPLAIAVLSILLAIPVAARPFNYLARVVRQVGGHSTPLVRWMWVPIVLGLVGIATIAALRAGGAVETTDELAPMWVVGVVAIAPGAIVLFLGWQAAVSVEEAITLAAGRRLGRSATRPGRAAPGAQPATTSTGSRRVRGVAEHRNAVRQVPGSDVLRFTIVVGLAGLAMLGVVGAAVMFMFWLETSDGVILPSQRERAWEVLDALSTASWVVGFGLGALVTIWTFIAVLNARLASGARRNPVLAALSWPLSALGIWWLAERLAESPSSGEVVAILMGQAAVMYVPFLLIERACLAVDARRTPVRISYCFALVLLVYTEALVTLSEATDTVTSFEFGRLAGFLVLGAVVLLLSTLAVTEACRSLALSTEYEANHHNSLVAQRQHIDVRAVRADAAVSG